MPPPTTRLRRLSVASAAHAPPRVHPSRRPGRSFPWHNRTYAETVRRKDDFPRQYDLLTQIDNGSFDVRLPAFELYDIDSDPFERMDLAHDLAARPHLERLQAALHEWLVATADRFVDPNLATASTDL